MISNLDEWLDYLGKLHPKEMDFGLDRVREVAQRLKLLPVSYKCIIVGGTNGKGTTCHLLESIYRQAGYKTGLHTSPHLLRFNERIILTGKMADDQSICEAFAQIEQARSSVSLTYFEFALLATLIIFRDAKIDVAILEVGLGGRLDAVNIVDADVAAITTIDFDHMQWLGHTREKIGYEKAGIFRKNTPAVCGDPAIPVTVLEYAKHLNSALFCQEKDFSFIKHEQSWEWQSQSQHFKELPLPHIPLQNASTALMIVECLELPLRRIDIDKALSHIAVQGRFQIIEKHCRVIVDVAHNPQSANLLAQNLKAQPCKGKTYAIFSALADKDLSGIVISFADIIDEWHYSVIKASRAASKQQLGECLQSYQSIYYESLEAAYQSVLEKARPEDRMVVFGSFYTVAAILEKESHAKSSS
ncbi:MAG: folC [Gammaproteobacteria bacterium]|jgi:dihydrofolate synthase/folylpolyglutamate synthase|nr:folC [Gammaproteobacteria bacterium]